MAKNDPLFGDVTANRGAAFDMSDIGWMGRARNPDGGYYDAHPTTGHGLFTGDFPGMEGSYGEQTGETLYGWSDVSDFLNQGGDYVNWTDMDHASNPNYTGAQAEAAMNNPAFGLYYNQFHDFDAPGDDPTDPAKWWHDYGKYFEGHEKGTKEAFTKRSGAIEGENLRLKALETLDKTKGFAGKRGFAGDSSLVKAQKSIQEEHMRTKDLQTLGVQTSLWDIHSNYMSNLYDQFANLAGLGAFEDSVYF